MGPDNRIAAESAWLYRLFTLGPAHVSLTGETLSVEGLLGGGPAKIPIGAIDSITVRSSWFWHRLTIRLGDGTEHSVGGLDEQEATRVRAAAIAAAVRFAKVLSPRLKQLDERLRQHFAGERYARYRDSQKLHEALSPALRECIGLIREGLDREAAEAVSRLDAPRTVRGVRGSEKVREQPLHFEQNPHRAGSHVRDAAETLLRTNRLKPSPPTRMRLLCLRAQERARPRSSSGKVAHLVRNQDVSPDQILILAYNHKAAAEIRGRLKGNLFGSARPHLPRLRLPRHSRVRDRSHHIQARGR